MVSNRRRHGHGSQTEDTALGVHLVLLRRMSGALMSRPPPRAGPGPGPTKAPAQHALHPQCKCCPAVPAHPSLHSTPAPPKPCRAPAPTPPSAPGSAAPHAHAPRATLPAGSLAANWSETAPMPFAGRQLDPEASVRITNSNRRLLTPRERSKKIPPRKGRKNWDTIESLKPSACAGRHVGEGGEGDE